MINLHLGCGQNIIPGFINCDLYSNGDFIYKINAIKLPFLNGVVNKIYACHILEHFSRHDIEDVLNEWNRVLKYDGKLFLSVPDFESIVKHYSKNKNIKEIQGLLNGGQDCEWNKHIVSFDFIYLKEILEKTGFSSIERYDWRNSEFSKYDDFSQAYLPHMDKENGLLMSLNVEAKKSI
jgi:ubiquinone/menaquinone biosynthesis C-methylase UbiE